MAPNVGWRLAGYTELGLLGEGRSGRTVVARHDATGARVAVKYLAPELVDRPESRARFRAEAGVLRQMAHPNVARVLEFVETAAGAAIVMELVEGPSLRQILRQSPGPSRPLPPEAALALLKGSLHGLAAAHRLGVVHRDYTPGNVVVRADGSTVLVDFGIAVAVGAADPTIEGTPWYMAPEQWAGLGVGPATDVYAATAVFHECLSTRPPYPFDGLDQLAHAHRTAPVPVLDAPPALQDLLTRGLAKDPAARPASASAFVAELDVAAGRSLGPDWESRGRAVLAAAVGMAPSAGPGGPAGDGAGRSTSDGGDPGGPSADVDGLGAAVGAHGQPGTSGTPVGLARTDGSAPPVTPGATGTDAAQAGGPRPDSARAADAPANRGDDLGTAVSHSADGGATRSGSGGWDSVISRLRPKTRHGTYTLAGGAGLGAVAVAVTVMLVVREPEPVQPQAAPPPQATVDELSPTSLAFVQDGTLVGLADGAAHPIRPFDPDSSYPSSVDFSADGTWLVGTDDTTVFAWNGPGSDPVELPCDACSAAYVDGPDGGRVAVVENGQVRRLDPATLDGGQPVPLQLPDAGYQPIVQGNVGGLLLISQPRETPSAYGGPDTLWLVDPVTGEVQASHDSEDNVAISDVAVSADGGLVAFTSYSHGGACYEIGHVTVLNGSDLSPVSRPEPPVADADALAVDDIFFNGDRIHAVMSGYADTGSGCEQVVPPALHGLERGGWQAVSGPPLSAVRPLEGLDGEGTGSFVVAPDGTASLRLESTGAGATDPPDLPGPIEPDQVWSTPTTTEVELR